MNKTLYRFALLSLAGIFTAFILFLQPCISEKKHCTPVVFSEFEVSQHYLIGQNFIRKGAIPMTLKRAYFVDKTGKPIDYGRLPFEWDIWLAEQGTYGALHVTSQELSSMNKLELSGRQLAEQAFALVLHIIPKEKNNVPRDYYIKLEYEVLGVKKHLIRKALTL